MQLTTTLPTSKSANSFAECLYTAVGYTLARTIQANNWWNNGGEQQIKAWLKSAVVFSLMAFVVASVAVYSAGYVVGFYSRKYWWPTAKQAAKQAAYVLEQSFSLEGDFCPCWGQTPDWSNPECVVRAGEVEEFTAWAFSRYGRVQGGIDAAGAVAWAEALIAA